MVRLCDVADQANTFETICKVNTWEVAHMVQTKGRLWHGGPSDGAKNESIQNKLPTVNVDETWSNVYGRTLRQLSQSD